MIYINSNIVSFPRHSRSEVVLLHLVNQLTQTNIDVEVTNTSTNPKLYTFDLSSAMLQLIAGQYNYYLYSLDKSVIGNGILQVEDYTTEDVNYNIEYNIIQYSPEDEEIIIPIRKLTIIENGEYDVTDYEKVIVEVAIDEEVIEEYEETISNLMVEIDDLNLQNEIKDVEINELKDSNTTLTNDLNSANEEISSLTLNVQYLENQNTTLTDDLNSANEQITTLNNEKVYLENINSTLNSELRSANAEINILEAEVGEKQAYIDTATAITITENGTYTPPTGVVGFNSISVDVSGASNPKYVLSNGTKLGHSSSTTDINNFIFSEVSNFGDMFSDCSNLTSIPLIDTSKGTNFSHMFYSCTKLTSIPLINTSNGTKFQSMFFNCTNLTSIPAIDTTKGTFLGGMFYNCKNLTSIPAIDTSNNTSFSTMFYGCTNLATIPLINTSKSTNFSNTFYNCTKLENITFAGAINVDIFLPNSPLLSFDSIKSILTAASNTTNRKSKTLTLNRSISDVDGELAALVATCASKGWTISGLTLQ